MVDVSFGVLDVARDAADETLQILSATREEKSALVAVGIDVRDCVGLQIFQVGFHPFDGAQ